MVVRGKPAGAAEGSQRKVRAAACFDFHPNLVLSDAVQFCKTAAQTGLSALRLENHLRPGLFWSVRDADGDILDAEFVRDFARFTF